MSGKRPPLPKETSEEPPFYPSCPPANHLQPVFICLPPSMLYTTLSGKMPLLKGWQPDEKMMDLLLGGF